MTMSEILESERQRVLSELSGEKTPSDTAAVCVRVLDRVLIRYNTDESSAARRAAASRMTEAAKALAPAMDSIGGTRLWERADAQGKQKKKLGFFPVFFLVLGLLAELFADGLWIYQTTEGKEYLRTFLSGWWMFIVPVMGGLLLLLSGSLMGRKKVRKPRKEQKVEVYTDADKVYRILHAVTLVMDRELKSVSDSADGASSEGEEHRLLSNSELQLYSNILEAGYASEEESIRECVEDLRFHLHRMGIEAVDYNEKNSGWFEKMPGTKTVTVRPALVSDGVLLQRGLVSGA